MNLAIRYYTRGGNTEKLANAISEELNIPAKKVSEKLTERADILFLGCSYYAFDVDDEVKSFIRNNKDNISKIVVFGTSAMIKSMLKPIRKVTDELGIEVSNDEFHCSGSFGALHKGRPNEDDIANAKKFAHKYL